MTEVIDLTGPSPPMRTRAFPQEASDAAAATRRSKRRRFDTQATRIVIDSDSDDADGGDGAADDPFGYSDDEVIVVDSFAGPSSSSGSTAAAPPSRRGPAASAAASGAFGRNPSGASTSQAGPSHERLGFLSRLAGRSPPAVAVRMAARRGTSTSRESSSSLSAHAAAALVDAAHPLSWGDFGGSGPASSVGAHLDHFYFGFGGGGVAASAFGGAFGHGLSAAMANYFGHGSGGLQGVIPPSSSASGLWGGAAKVGKGKRYGVRTSHPRPLQDGFERNIVNPEDPDYTPPCPPKRRKGRRAPSGAAAAAAAALETMAKPLLVPGCASCLEPLRLAQSGLGRPWGLKCGHVVCGRCVRDARTRCEDIRAAERKARWTIDITAFGANMKGKGKAKAIIIDDDEEGEPDDDPLALGGGRASAKTGAVPPPSGAVSASAKGKGKEKSRAVETGVDDEWTSCPVLGCDGAGTDLLAKEGDYDGPFEAFL